MTKVSINCYGVPCIGWEFLHPQATPDHLGYIPLFINTELNEPLARQIDREYVSGWHPLKEWKYNRITGELKYPGDPTMRPIARYQHKPTNETLYLYDCGVVCIEQDDGKFEASRVD